MLSCFFKKRRSITPYSANSSLQRRFTALDFGTDVASFVNPASHRFSCEQLEDEFLTYKFENARSNLLAMSLRLCLFFSIFLTFWIISFLVDRDTELFLQKGVPFFGSLVISLILYYLMSSGRVVPGNVEKVVTGYGSMLYMWVVLTNIRPNTCDIASCFEEEGGELESFKSCSEECLVSWIRYTLMAALDLPFWNSIIMFTGVVNTHAFRRIFLPLCWSTHVLRSVIMPPPSAVLPNWFMVLNFAFPMVHYVLAGRQDTSRRQLFLVQRSLNHKNQDLEKKLGEVERTILFDKPTETECDVVKEVLGNADELRGVELNFSELKMCERIGAGSFGEVIRAEYDGRAVAVKRLLRNRIDKASLTMFRTEIGLLRNLHHPNIVQFVGASWDSVANICIVLEYVERGSLQDALFDTKLQLSWDDPMLKMLVDVVSGLAYLHSRASMVLHRDMKPENVLVTPTFGCKLTDFGAAREMLNDNTMTKIGTPVFMAPELSQGHNYNERADVYSLGIMMVMMHTRKTPYTDFHGGSNHLQHRVVKGLRPEVPGDMPAALATLAKDCWAANPADRPPSSEVLSRLRTAQTSAGAALVADSGRSAAYECSAEVSQPVVTT